MKLARCLTLAACAALSASYAHAQVVINEFQYDDTGTADDREFVELYNAGTSTVTIGDYVLAGRDASGANTATTITTGTTLAPGAYYVIGNAGTLNVNQTAAGGFLENDNETIELFDGPIATGTLLDAVAYETNKGAAFASAVSGQIGPGIFSNFQAADVGTSPQTNAVSTVSLGRFINGRDTNNNGRDFGLRPSTPGSTNAPGGTMVAFTPPDASAFAVGAPVPSLVGSFVPARAIDPTVVDGNNPNAISRPDGGGNAFVGWDPSGGGNGITTTSAYDVGPKSFALQAYLDTRDLPTQTNASAVEFRGAEVTIYGIGSGDALTNLTDLGGDIGLGAATLPLTESANGFTGLAWVYEKVGLGTTAAPAGVSEKLYLVDANDGGDSDVGGNTPLDWTILQTIDLSGLASDWFDLTISVDALGVGTASFNGQVFNFTTSTDLATGAFNIGYRENLQVGADGTPDALLRPATFAAIAVPEPTTLAALAGLGTLAIVRRRKA